MKTNPQPSLALSPVALTLPLLVLLVSGCASTQNRNMNPGEQTLVSPEVEKLVDELGEVDVRFAENLYCERIRRVGTHLVTRICYDSREAARKKRESMHRLQRGSGVGAIGCGSGSCDGLPVGRPLPSLPGGGKASVGR